MNLFRALATVSGLTLVSRILGFIRDWVIARSFGAGVGTDAFFVAFRIPNLLRRLFAEGAFSQAFVPLLAEYRQAEGEAKTRVLLDGVATTLALVLAVTALIGVVAAPAIVMLTAPGFTESAEAFDLTTRMLRITFPYVGFISLVALSAAVLTTWSRFAVPAFTPSLLNLALIVGAIFFAPAFDPPVVVLAWAVVAGGVLQLAFQLPFLARLGMLPRWRIDWRHPGLRRLLRQMAPALFGVSVAQLSLLINTIFASFLATGSVSWLYYADRLMEFPAGMLGAALGTILLPSLSRHHAAGDAAAYSRVLDWGLRITVLLAVPAAVALGVLAGPLVITLFHYGRFTAEDAEMTRQALMAYSIGLVGMILVKILAPGFYARQDIGTPVRIGVLTLVATQLMNLAFVLPLRHAGLALAIGLAACINALFLYRGLRRIDAYRPAPGWVSYGMKVAVAVILMGAVLHSVSGPQAWWLAAGALTRALATGGLVLLGTLVYGFVLLMLGVRPRQFAKSDEGSASVEPDRKGTS